MLQKTEPLPSESSLEVSWASLEGGDFHLLHTSPARLGSHFLTVFAPPTPNLLHVSLTTLSPGLL